MKPYHVYEYQNAEQQARLISSHRTIGAVLRRAERHSVTTDGRQVYAEQHTRRAGRLEVRGIAVYENGRRTG